MTLSEKVKKVTSARNEAKPEMLRLKEQIISIKTHLEKIIEFNDSHSSIWHDIVKQKDPENLIIWEKICLQIDSLYEEICASLNANSSDKGFLEQAYLRASREYLNLAFMGPWRQGKSLAFTRLTNLKSILIPVADGKNCTGTTINVVCDSYKPEDGKEYNDVAVVYHYSVEEMCNVINNYCQLIQLNIKISAQNIADFKSKCAQKSTEILNYKGTPVEYTAYYRTLCEYIENINDYANELTGVTERIDDILSSEVSQNRYYPLVAFRVSPTNGEKHFKCLATKKAELYTEYKLLDEVICMSQVLDTPGIGESRIGVNEALESALRKDVDIAVAVNKVESTYTDEAEVNKFHDILKKELSERQAADFLFYFFNVNTTSLVAAEAVAKANNRAFSQKQIIEDKKKDVLSSLAISTEKAHGITLPIENIKVLDFNTGKELVKYEGTDPVFSQDSGLTNIFHGIMNIMAGRIASVDEVFYKKARKQSERIKKQWKSLLEDINRISLPNYSTTSIIHSKLKELNEALKKLGRNVDLTECITTDIEGFCNEPSGIEVGRVLNYKGDDIDADKDIKEIIEILLPFMKVRLNSRDYNARKEFVIYNEVKTDLRDILKTSINERIDETEAQTLLNEVKKEICNVLRSEGALAFIDNDPDTWLDSFVSLLSTENEYPALTETLTQFRDYKINAKEKLEDTIDDALNQGYHCDNFGDSDIYSFEPWENAIKSMLHSFYQIEGNTKSIIKDDILRKKLRGLQVKFDEMLNPVLSLADVEGTGRLSPNREDLHHFYEIHSDEIFSGLDEAMKQEIIEKWRILIKQ